jgi:hypothetical protein
MYVYINIRPTDGTRGGHVPTLVLVCTHIYIIMYASNVSLSDVFALESISSEAFSYDALPLDASPQMVTIHIHIYSYICIYIYIYMYIYIYIYGCTRL